MKTIIMAGGEGTRLRPLTCDRPKPMVPVMNKPIMEYIINLLKKYKLVDIGVTLQYLPDVIQSYFGDGSEFGVSLTYYIEEVPLGTAGSVKNAEEFLDDTFLVISGDALIDINLNKVISFHREKKAIATLVLTQVDCPLEYGVVITDSQGHIKQFLEKPTWGEVFSDKVNTGIYILEPEVLNFFDKGQNFDFSKDLFPWLLKEGFSIYGYIVPGYWCDVGNIQSYQQVHLDIFTGKANLETFNQYKDIGIHIGKGTYIDPQAHIRGSAIIGENCFIGPGVGIEDHTVIGNNVVIEEQSTLKRSIIWDNCHIGKKAQLRGAILTNKVKIQENVSVFEGAVVGDSAFIGRNSQVKPNIKIWPHKQIDSGTVVNSSIIWAKHCSRILFGNGGVIGRGNLKITPDFTARLGSAYGTWLGTDSIIGVGADDFEISQALKAALIAGIVSTGIDVKDLGRVVTPISRHNIRQLGLKGGIQVQISQDSQGEVIIKFFDARGVEISRSDERKIENIMAREEFRRAKFHLVGNCTYLPEATNNYRKAILNSIDLDNFRTRQFKMVVAYPSEYLANLIQPLLIELGCKILQVRFDSGKTDNLKDIVIENVLLQQADLGVIFNSNMEKLILVSDTGQLVEEEWFTVLISLLVLSSKAGSRVVVPVNIPSVVERIAERFQGKVIRTKSTPQSFMNTLMNEELGSDQENGYQFLLHSDGFIALTQILSFLYKNQLKLSQLLKEIPEFYLSKKVVNCPWEVKGRVIRTLIEEQQKEPELMELLEGVKIYHPQGWSLILPDGEEPVCRVYSEGFSQEIADSLTDWYSEKIESINKEK